MCLCARAGWGVGSDVLDRPLPSPRCLGGGGACFALSDPPAPRESPSGLSWAPRLRSDPWEPKFSTQWGTWNFLWGMARVSVPAEEGTRQRGARSPLPSALQAPGTFRGGRLGGGGQRPGVQPYRFPVGVPVGL